MRVPPRTASGLTLARMARMTTSMAVLSLVGNVNSVPNWYFRVKYIDTQTIYRQTS